MIKIINKMKKLKKKKMKILKNNHRMKKNRIKITKKIKNKFRK